MSVESRRQLILDQLDQQGAFSYRELTELLGVSTMTVRRDIDELARQGAVIKALGGVQRANAPTGLYETTLVSRFSEHNREKRAIAERALDLIGPQQTIFLDGSSTCLELAKVVSRQRKGLTVVTNSLLACLEMGQNGQNTVIGIGGEYDRSSASFVGPTSEDLAGKLYVDLAMVSTKGFLPAEGTFESSVSTFRIKQIIARQCAEMVLLVDHSKLGQRGLCKVLDISQIHTVVTDSKAPQEDLDLLGRGGQTVYVCPVGDSPVEDAASAS